MARPETPPPQDELLVSPTRSSMREERKRKSEEDPRRDPRSAVSKFLTRDVSKLHAVTLTEFQRIARNKTGIMIEAALDRIQQIEGAEGTYDIECKPGFTTGFIITNSQSGKRYFVKEFLNPPRDGQIDYNEFFTYKVLEYLGYGPKCHVSLYAERKALLISHDLSDIKTKEDGSITRKKFQTYKEIDAERILDAAHFTNFSTQFCAHLMAIEILIPLLAMKDVHCNHDNAGLAITSGPKTDDGEDKIKPKVVDFVCSRLDLDAHCDRPSSKLTLEEVVAFTESPKHSSSHISRIDRARKEQAYSDALNNILNGRRSRPPIEVAIERAFADCKKIMGVESDPFLDKRIEGIRERVAGLQRYVTDRRSESR